MPRSCLCLGLKRVVEVRMMVALKEGKRWHTFNIKLVSRLGLNPFSIEVRCLVEERWVVQLGLC